MMNKYITALKHKGLHSHQMFIKSIQKMKRRTGLANHIRHLQ